MGDEELQPNKVQKYELIKTCMSSDLLRKRGKEREQTVYLCPICSKDDVLVSPKRQWESRSFRRETLRLQRFHHADFPIALNMTFALKAGRTLPADAQFNCRCTLCLPITEGVHADSDF